MNIITTYKLVVSRMGWMFESNRIKCSHRINSRVVLPLISSNLNSIILYIIPHSSWVEVCVKLLSFSISIPYNSGRYYKYYKFYTYYICSISYSSWLLVEWIGGSGGATTLSSLKQSATCLFTTFEIQPLISSIPESSTVI